MNKLLVRKKTFAPNGPQMVDLNSQVIEDKKNLIFSMANANRDANATPVFVSDPVLLPVTNTATTSTDTSAVIESVDLKDVSEMTVPPSKGICLSDLEKGIIVAVAAVLVIKILS